MEQATARLRKTFQYKADDDDDDDDLPEALDEEEQSHLITHLSTLSTAQNNLYTRLLLLLPLLCTLPYLSLLFHPAAAATAGTTTSTTLLSALSISSLLISAWVLWAMPTLPTLPALPPIPTAYMPWIAATIQTTADKRRDSNARTSTTPAAVGQRLQQQRREAGPMERYLPWLNAVAAAVVLVAGVVRDGGYVKEGEEGEEEGWWFAVVPGLVYGVVLLARGIMGSVDVEGELERLRYGLKGA